LPEVSVRWFSNREAGATAAERLDVKGIVAKRMVDPYQPKTVWYVLRVPPGKSP
jgi:hypothetical protein